MQCCSKSIVAGRCVGLSMYIPVHVYEDEDMVLAVAPLCYHVQLFLTLRVYEGVVAPKREFDCNASMAG